jgi:hypothetical protein
MNFNKCPLCEKIREEKLKLFNSFSKEFFPSLCKEHLFELSKIKDLSFIDWRNYRKEECYICSFEEKIEEEFLREFKEYDKLCIYHLKKVKDKLGKEDWEKLINKWEEFDKYLEILIESYDYKKEKISSNYLYLILDHLLGTGRKI